MSMKTKRILSEKTNDMTLKEVMETVNDIFIEILEDEEIELKYGTNTDDIKEWDSLTNIELVVAIEKEFNIRFVLSEFYKFQNVGQMCEYISNDVSHK